MDAIGAQVHRQQQVSVLGQMMDMGCFLPEWYSPVSLKMNHLHRGLDAAAQHGIDTDAAP